MNLNKIEMVGDWILVDGTGCRAGHGVVVKGFGVEMPIGCSVRFRTADYFGKMFPFIEDDRTYIAVRYEDIFSMEMK
jgi:hypothetical protein